MKMTDTEKKAENKSRHAGARRKKNSRKNIKGGSLGRRILLGIAVLSVILGSIAVWRGRMYIAVYSPDDDAAGWVYIPAGATRESVRDSLESALGKDFGGKVASVWRGESSMARGAYRVEPGARAWRVAKKIGRGIQSPVKVSFNNMRTLEQLSERLAARMEFSADDFITACDSVAKARGMNRDTLATYLFPDTYEAFWTDSPARLLARMEEAHSRFWTPTRREKAAELGLTPAKAYILASIVEEESAKRDERPVIGRLYLNRLKNGMLLQADPTVKFACGDFAARRITGDMLRKDSPYNTYRVKGLPPGPIRLAEASTIDGILSSAPNSYIYMCAKADFSGRHAFASDYEEHRRNAAAYHKALDARGIKK